MEIKTISQDKEKLVFEISGINDVQANTLRRLIVAEIPTMAIQEVEIIKNDSALYDEIISHRLGLTPLEADLKTYNLKERCTCKEKGCAKCQVKLTLEEEGPAIINASSLKSKDPSVKPVLEKMPIVHLIEDQKIKLIATAELGKGKVHMKFSPGIAVYKNKPTLKITKDEKIINKYKDLIPKRAFKNNNLEEKQILENNLYEAIESISQDLIKVDYQEDSFIFTIESFGQSSPQDMFKNAIKEFDYKLDEFAKELKYSKKKKISKILKK
jgi:DNA-directed RNA polymerase subunit D